mmetsp:Transcript_18602/g.56146  ORF Transcript_18602/g.56146 Transcript_18602/m.56146 type:complete len:216 (+) Transcript_18602:700-1347(+)
MKNRCARLSVSAARLCASSFSSGMGSSWARPSLTSTRSSRQPRPSRLMAPTSLVGRRASTFPSRARRRRAGSQRASRSAPTSRRTQSRRAASNFSWAIFHGRSLTRRSLHSSSPRARSPTRAGSMIASRESSRVLALSPLRRRSRWTRPLRSWLVSTWTAGRCDWITRERRRKSPGDFASRRGLSPSEAAGELRARRFSRPQLTAHATGELCVVA